MKRQYIQSVIELLEAGEKPETVLNNLKKTLQARGHSSLHCHILLGALRKLSSRSRVNTPVVTVAKIEDKNKFASAIKDALVKLDAGGKDTLFVEDKSITGGFIATYSHQSIDASYKSKLLSWYRVATKN